MSKNEKRINFKSQRSSVNNFLQRFCSQPDEKLLIIKLPPPRSTISSLRLDAHAVIEIEIQNQRHYSLDHITSPIISLTKQQHLN